MHIVALLYATLFASNKINDFTVGKPIARKCKRLKRSRIIKHGGKKGKKRKVWILEKNEKKELRKRGLKEGGRRARWRRKPVAQ